jgi:hypothetical protein
MRYNQPIGEDLHSGWHRAEPAEEAMVRIRKYRDVPTTNRTAGDDRSASRSSC